MSKQDRIASRTPADIERKYNFGKTFAEVFGLAEDARKSAELAQEAADKAVSELGELDQTTIFNLLTNNGELKGLFMKDGELYINASYILTGSLLADLIETGVIKSADNTVALDLNNNEITVETSTGATGTRNGKIVMSNLGFSCFGTHLATGELNRLLHIGSGFQYADGTFFPSYVSAPYIGTPLHISSNGKLILQSTANEVEIIGESIIINDKTVSWKDNGDGTFTLIGQ